MYECWGKCVVVVEGEYFEGKYNYKFLSLFNKLMYSNYSRTFLTLVV